ncbi:MAG TPA: TonB-dependent receptor [Steroidobacter sp.]|nr:TonB-dependent receptor [Steroidobacter sp.]
MIRKKAVEVAAVSAVGLLAGGVVAAQDAGANNSKRRDLEKLEEITVSATRSRLPANLESVPGSVTIIDAAQLQEQTQFSNDLGEMLQRLVPGLGVSSSGSYSNTFQTLRGRKPAVFIDGVPSTVPLRDGARDMRLISPAAIGRVDVIRGATAIYGLGASGGVINYATREAGDGPPEMRTVVGVGGSLTHPEDSLNWSVEQTGVARFDRWSIVASGFYESYNSLFDASSERILPDPQRQGGIADTNTYDYYAKVGYAFSDTATLYLSSNLYSTVQDTAYNAGTKGVFGSVPADAVRSEPPGEDKLTRSHVSILRYEQTDMFLGSVLNLSGYYSDYDARYGYALPPQNFPPNGGQSQIEAQRWGLRSDINTPLQIGGRTGSVLWGIDYTHDTSVQMLRDGRIYVPEMVAKSYAPFFQLEVPVNDWLNVRGGMRYDDTNISVNTFTTIAQSPTLLGGVTVQGGEVGFTGLVGNIGVATSAIDDGAFRGFSFYAGFSQGYSIGDFGRALAATRAPSVDVFNFKADTVNSYEIGMRTDRDGTKTQLALFYSDSDYGSTFNAITYELIRAPEKLWGAEFSIDSRAADNWGWGASVSWVDGQTQNVTTGVWSKLDTTRIGPVKTTLYIERDIGETWKARGQFLHSARQSRFAGNPAVFGRADVEAFSLLDLSFSGKVGPGSLAIAINNALNEDYYTPNAWRQAFGPYFTKGTGATMRLSYTVDY